MEMRKGAIDGTVRILMRVDGDVGARRPWSSMLVVRVARLRFETSQGECLPKSKIKLTHRIAVPILASFCPKAAAGKGFGRLQLDYKRNATYYNNPTHLYRPPRRVAGRGPGAGTLSQAKVPYHRAASLVSFGGGLIRMSFRLLQVRFRHRLTLEGVRAPSPPTEAAPPGAGTWRVGDGGGGRGGGGRYEILDLIYYLLGIEWKRDLRSGLDDVLPKLGELLHNPHYGQGARLMWVSVYEQDYRFSLHCAIVALICLNISYLGHKKANISIPTYQHPPTNTEGSVWEIVFHKIIDVEMMVKLKLFSYNASFRMSS
ncbi:uncharacterized protein BDR25DRAFT_361582 [Lindgomyces ingoldianus]|uniref:Uncharacterized protein n=1 Tax=Lindgomyces ingoldianus TaxID=673940 RepID=A0ACB6QBT0_9PLEO|nr:uncharacterized protein BDR25DRAFT_361582 [Lindgomyces ingoldianus]KAF2464504.1 hypothetical protein BDR25DRAFT_361582 [Lindgomyces ingoldianus]